MHRFFILLSLVVCSCATAPNTPPACGPLIIVGGGGTPTPVIKRAVELSGKNKAIVAILPQASRRKERGQKSALMFLAAGAQVAFVIDDLEPPAAKAKLLTATLVWMPGGSQNRLMESIRDANLGATLRMMHAQGVAFGGTSAGAAVQSQLMITGEAELKAILPNGTKLGQGLGLMEGTIIDQHAIKRRRFNRLLAAILDHPDQIGIAIDEKTAIIFRNKQFEVMGASSVLVIDARDSTSMPLQSQAPHAARDIHLHVLRDGMSFDLSQRP